MGKRTSVYLDEQLARDVEASGTPLAVLIRRGLSGPCLIEEAPSGDYVTHWYCEVPPKDARFKVLRDHWLHSGMGTDRTQPTREIYEIEVTQS